MAEITFSQVLTKQKLLIEALTKKAHMQSTKKEEKTSAINSDGASWSTIVEEGKPVNAAGFGATTSTIRAMTSGAGWCQHWSYFMKGAEGDRSNKTVLANGRSAPKSNEINVGSIAKALSLTALLQSHIREDALISHET
ncbi:hypothetical protein Tco_1405598 [Tanacetum coccineum]